MQEILKSRKQMSNIEIKTIICKTCKLEKPLTEFWPDRSKKNGRTQCKQCINKKRKERELKLKNKVFSHYAEDPDHIACQWCGDTEMSRLCLDHVNAGGREYLKSVGLGTSDPRKVRSGTVYYFWLYKNDYPTEPLLQVLCRECNDEKIDLYDERKRKSKAGKETITVS